MTKSRKKTIFLAAVLVVLLAAGVAVDLALPSYHIAVKVIKKATVYALVAVSMNLLNGFTGLFSLGQAGFMLLGAVAYGVLTIPVADRAGVYQYFDGGLVQFSLPELLGGGTVGTTVGMLLALAVGGILSALVAWLIGLPVLRLKSDYLAIATLGFAEILRAFFQWNALGPITNGVQPAAGLSGLPACHQLYPPGGATDRGDRAADQLHLRPGLQGHPGRRGGRRGHGHQPGQATSGWPSSSAPSSPAWAAACWPCTTAPSPPHPSRAP